MIQLHKSNQLFRFIECIDLNILYKADNSSVYLCFHNVDAFDELFFHHLVAFNVFNRRFLFVASVQFMLFSLRFLPRSFQNLTLRVFHKLVQVVF